MTARLSGASSISAARVSAPPPGARESNAGDDFHILWAARRAVQLLAPRAKLRRVVVEGVTPSDGLVGDGDDLFLGVDFTEYHAGDDFASASAVIVAQLKYSTRHPKREWTASRLCSATRIPTGGRTRVSVIRRLADVYRGFVSQAPRGDVVRKLTIQLVSNQPLSNALAMTLSVAQAYLQDIGIGTAVSTAKLLKAVPPDERIALRKLQEQSGLPSGEFTDFLRILDMSRCGEASRSFQRFQLIRELSQLVSTNPVANLRALCDLIANEALPERAGSVGLAAVDVLASLEVGHPDDLFPAPAQLSRPDPLIETSDAKLLAACITTATGGRVLAHGNAGAGKTTTVQEIDRHLPTGSVVITYDCFAGGSWLEPGEQRHIQRRAFLQLTNELALHCGTPFLLRPAHEMADLQRHFRKSLEAAAKIVADTADALLVLVIDAADNAVIAARQSCEDSFIPILWRMPFPTNCRLLMTSRSHRRASLDPSPGVVEYELTGFDETASAANLRSVFPQVDGQQCSVFHTVTGGVPRVQRYLLSRMIDTTDPSAALESLLPAERIMLGDIFDDLWDAAVTYAANPTQARQYLALLLALPRPVSTRVFAECSGLGIDNAENVCRALIPGLVVEDDTVSFRDEDFETYLRDKLSDSELRAAHHDIGTFFLSRADRDAYAARHVADHLFAAERYSDTLDLVLERQPPLGIEDNLLRLAVTQRRLTLALRAAHNVGHEDDLVRVVLLAAEAAQSDQALTALVRENPDLAALYGDAESVARLYMREEHTPWLGSAHLRAAAVLARDPAKRDRARDHLQAADAWLRRWVALPKPERQLWQVDTIDIARGAEAVFWLEGSVQARAWLRRWRPPRAVLAAVGELAASLVQQLTDDQLDEQLRDLELPAGATAAILVELWQAGWTPPRDLVATGAERLVAVVDQRKHRGMQPQDWVVPFCELAAARGLEPVLILRLAQGYGPPFPGRVPYEHEDLQDYDLSLRSVCLQAALTNQDVTAETLLPEKYRQEVSNTYDRYSSERHRFHESIGKILPVYRVRARAIVSPLELSAITDEIADGLSARRADSEHRWFTYDPRYKLWASRACDALMRCTGDAGNLIRGIADTAKQTVGSAAADVWIELAELLIPHPSYRPFAYELLGRAADLVTTTPYPGRERWQTLLSCARVASRYDHALGQEYYQRGLVAAEGIDDDTALLLSFQADIARAATPCLSSDEQRHVAVRLVRLVESQEPYVSETSLLPWAQILETVTALATPAGFALCSRWDDENRYDLHAGVRTVVRTAREHGYISAVESLALLRLAGEHFDVSEDAIRMLRSLHQVGAPARPQLVEALKVMSAWICRDVPISSRHAAADRIIKWAEECGLATLPGIAELRNLVSFAGQYQPEAQSDVKAGFRLEPASDHIVEEVLGRARSASLTEVDADLRAIRAASYDGKPILQYLEALARATSPSERPALLDTIVAAGSNGLLAPYVAQTLERLLRQWQYSRAVQEWAPTGVSLFLDSSLPTLLSDYYADADISALLSTPPLAGHSRADALLPAVIKHLPALGPPNLYKVARVLTEALPATAVRSVLTWSLDRLESRVEADGRTLQPIPVAPLPESTPEGLARFLWALFGHPDKLVRWRAVHAAYELLRLPDKTLLAELVQLSRSEIAEGFRSATLEFYYLSARAWLLTLLLRLAHERPGELREHIQVLVEHATSPALPHAQIRELARRTTLPLLVEMPELLPHEIVEQLQFVNLPRACLYPPGHPLEPRSGGSTGRDHKRAERFHFWMDTEEYWFSDLAQIFGSSKEDVTARAERWICDHWGRTTEDWWHDSRELGGRYKRRALNNWHGSIPDVETLRSYLEFHAMCCAAGEMVDSLPTEVEIYDDEPSDRWSNWLREHLPSSDQYWLADLRGTTPFRPDCWGRFTSLKDWLRRVDASEYESALGWDEPGHTAEMVIRGHHEFGDMVRHGTVRVSSALVSPATARSLLRALQTADPNDFLLPIYGIGRDDARISQPGFDLQPWLLERSLHEALDKVDPLARVGTTSLTEFGGDFLSTVEASASPERLEFLQADGRVIGRLELWNDRLEKDRATGPYSSGERLWVRFDTLLGYLQRCDRDLIIEVRIAHNRSEESRREEGEKYDIGRTTIYLLRRDGSLETMAGRREAGRADRT
jgi:hypothetical protein